MVFILGRAPSTPYYTTFKGCGLALKGLPQGVFFHRLADIAHINVSVDLGAADIIVGVCFWAQGIHFLPESCYAHQQAVYSC